MSRHVVAGRSTVVGTTVRAIASVFGVSGRGGWLREFKVFNTTNVAVAVALVRFTNATGVGTGLTEVDYDPDLPALLTGFAGHTADGAVGAPFEYGDLGAAVGSAVLFTFGDTGVKILPGTANGIGCICPVGAGQILDYSITWDE